jgi:hypothetical protein
MWHKKQKDKKIMPKRLRGVDKQATWGMSKANGWIYGHGTFMLTPHQIPVVGIFKWMPNSGNEAKRMELEVNTYKEIIDTVCMDSKADDQNLFYRLKTEQDIHLITVPRKGMDKSESRKKYIADMLTIKSKKEYKNRSTTVEPMQGLMKNIFELGSCWMRGNENNRWLFAAMGIAVQMAQWNAFKNNTSTWKVKPEVLGV